MSIMCVFYLYIQKEREKALFDRSKKLMFQVLSLLEKEINNGVLYIFDAVNFPRMFSEQNSHNNLEIGCFVQNFQPLCTSSELSCFFFFNFAPFFFLFLHASAYCCA